MNNLYNIHIENSTELFTIFELDEIDLKKVVEAYDIGKEDIFINGRRYQLKGLKEIRIFDMRKLKGSLRDFLNFNETKIYHHFEGSKFRGVKLPAHYLIGNDITKDFITNDYGWKKQTAGPTLLNHVSDVPVLHLQKVLNLLNELNDKHGFKSTDFAPPEPSNLNTPQVGWRLHLKNSPQYFFYFRENGNTVSIKHFPNKTENKERNVNISVGNGKSFEIVQTQAIAWLKIIADGIQEQKRWNDIFNPLEVDEYTPYENIDDENDNSSKLTQKEIEAFRIFLNAFDDLIQSSRALPKETKTAYSEMLEEAEDKLENRPTKSFFKWFKKILDAVTVKYLTDHKYRDEVHSYFNTAIEKAKNLGQLGLEWIKSD